MFARNVARAAIALLLALVFNAAAGASTTDHTPPTTPTNLRVTAFTGTLVRLAWNASTDDSGSFSYRVRESTGVTFTVSQTQTTFSRSRLAPERTYTYSVYAVDAAGNRSGDSNTVSYTTPRDVRAPTPPPTLTTTTVYPTRVSVAWTESVDNVSQVFYTLLVDGSPYGADLINYRAATVLHLMPSTTHVLRVSVRDAYGNTAQSNVLSVTTPAATDTVPPTAPANLSLSSESAPPEAWLDWDQSTDNTDPQSQILYEVYLNGVRNDDGVIGYGSTVTYCREAGMTTIMVKAVDTSGNESAPSNEILFPC